MERRTALTAALVTTLMLASAAATTVHVTGRASLVAPGGATSCTSTATSSEATSARLVRTSKPRPTHRGAGVLALDWGDLDTTPNAGAGDYVVMEPWEYPRIPALRQANPQLRILMYKDASATVRVADESGIFPTGVSYAEVALRHPAWFLTDADGHRLEWSDWTGLYPLNIRNAGYQRAWLHHVLGELRAHDWDGVMLDDTLTYLSHPTVADRVAVQIPTDSSMYRATGTFLAYVGPRIRGAGYMAVPNLTVEWNTWKTTLADWSRFVSGWENEYFVKWGLEHQTRFDGADWEWKMRMASWCAARRLPLLAITYSNRDDRAAQSYHRATWLLTWNGRTGASIFVPAELGASHWVPLANTYLGAPTGPQKQTGGVHTRTFAHGLVLVNPTPRHLTVSLRNSYWTLSGRRVRDAHLAPRAGLLLRTTSPADRECRLATGHGCSPL